MRGCIWPLKLKGIIRGCMETRFQRKKNACRPATSPMMQRLRGMRKLTKHATTEYDEKIFSEH